jgi:branched-chain amino acid aminotransferase
MPHSTVWLNGAFCPMAQAHLSPADRGFLLGDGVFTTLRAHQGQPEYLREHQARLYAHAHALAINPPALTEPLNAIIQTLLAANNLQEGYAAIRMTLTRGAGGRGLDINPQHVPTFLMTAVPYTPPTKPLRCHISAIKRVADGLSHIKHLGYVPAIMARHQSRAAGYDDAILTNEHGRLVCATAGNIFCLIKNKWITPPLTEGCLPGVMRARILAQNPHINERPIHLEDIALMQAMVITNSLVGAHPLEALGQHSLDPHHPAFN